MSIRNLFDKWTFAIRKRRLCKRLIKRKDILSLNLLLKFLIERKAHFPMTDRQIRETLFDINNLSTVDEKYREYLFSSVEYYLFDNTQNTRTEEWRVWLKECRKIGRRIETTNPAISKALLDALSADKLSYLPKEDLDYLLNCYFHTYGEILKVAQYEEQAEILSILLEFATIVPAFIKDKNILSLNLLLKFLIERNLSFSMNEHQIRETLFSIDNLSKVEEAYRNYLFSSIEHYLFGNTQNSRAEEWRVWLKECRKLDRRIEVTNPIISRALLNAQRANKLGNLPKKEQEYLLNCYLHAYGEILEAVQYEEQAEILPVLLEFATIAHLLDREKTSLKTLKRWASHLLSHPRSLLTMNDEQAFYAPIRGIGSPHSVSITFYHNSLSDAPMRVTSAGVTGDATLNSQIFTNLFATALACDSEPTFITSNGCILSLDAPKINDKGRSQETLLSAVIGPAGPVQPGSGTPTLGMEANEALMIVADTFQKLQKSTGLVQTVRWDIEDANQLENRVAQTLALSENRSHIIKSPPQKSEGASLVHIMPLLHRNKHGKVEPIEIEVPYSIVNPRRVLSILRKARQAYMQQLIAAGQRRKVMAEQAYEEQDEMVKYWESLDERKKQAICARNPWVFITQMYNFELGIITIVDPPEQVPRKDYEESSRPQIRDHAKQYAKEFADLCRKLEDLNKGGGKADILTFKLLFDSMIRRSPVAIANTEFQNEYKDWVDFNSITVWAAIEDWAKNRGLSPEILAADNILFNAKLKATSGSILIQPWVIIDPHDFVIHVDCQHGLMYSFPGGKTPTLIDTLIPDPENGITDLKGLHEQFCTWITHNLNPQDENKRKREEEVIRSKIYDDPKIKPVVQLRAAKHLLFKGKVSRAKELIQSVRHADLAPIYFWGAVAHQYQYIEKHATELRLNLSELDDEQKYNRIVNVAIRTLINPLPTESLPASNEHLIQTILNSELNPGLSEKNVRSLLASMQRQLSVPIVREAKTYLNQLQACAPSFIRELEQQTSDIHKLEDKTLHLSSDEQKRVQAAVYALSSLEFLHLAETMKNVAKDLPFTGSLTPYLRKTMDELLDKIHSLTYRDSSISKQLEDLAKML